MPRFHRLAGAVALALGCAGAAQAQNFTGFFVFGDSLSDAGNVAAISGLPPGNSFTTNPDPVAAEIIARYFGLPSTNSLAGGPNFAWGGACVTATGPCLNAVPRIPTQITQYLTATGGRADPNALYSVWGGANDIFASLGNPATAQANTVAAATSYVQQIGRLQAAGARYIVVYNLPNLGATPQFGASPTTASSVSQITVVYNSALNTGLASLGDGIIAINTFGLIAEIVANPGLYGFTNVTGVACTGSSVACGPSGSGLPATYAPGTNDTYLFADGVHPTGAAHRILANVVLSTIAAPIQVSYAGEGGLQAAADHGRAINDELMSDFQLNREVGSVRGFATVNFGQHEYEDNASTNILGGDADALSLTLGANHRISDNAYWGVGITLGNHDNSVASADIDSNSVIGSIGGALRFGGGGYVHGSVSGGSTDVEISRFIEMGATVREESGTTNASQYGAELGLGWLFGSAEGLQHGPFIGAQWVQQTVDGYAESSGSATSMNFSEFDRDSLVTRVGYQLMGNLGDSERAIRPFARVAFNEEGEDDQVRVNAGSNSMPGRFTLGGFTPSQDWISADVGVQFMVGESTTAYLSYNGRFADDLQDRNTFGLGLRTTF
ncbi:autotransporter domain-containing protein [Arenimonas sp.]|uniref:autotransporter domain-containing protein n=1 Tax=Arenimonas sp. TaxID=1872635 RepID=UPI002E35D070|nr:autotransporter domain-containing protein [Arenimonas sp.]HEX4853956.1 autotransporter domain-containing protein [Arenimonas sp.]